MPRALTVSRVRIPEGDEPAYLAAVAELEALHEGRGRHLWLFRRSGSSGEYLECSESRTVEEHRSRAELPEDERRVEARLRELAQYQPGAWELWEEVRSGA